MIDVLSHYSVLIVVGLVALLIGGELFVKAASNLGRRLGLSDLFVGLAIVGFGTSAAELAVSVDAALQGSSDIALSNVVGSNIANIALVLGVTAVIKSVQVDARSLRRDIPVMLVATVALLVLLLDGTLSRLEGGFLLACLVIYLSVAGWQARNAPTDPETIDTGPHVVITLLTLVAAVGLLILGSHFLVAGAVTVAQIFKVNEAVVGATVVAIGTSLPEITVSVLAALRGRTDMALGNIVGSNIWNILAVLGTASLIFDLPRGNVGWDMLGFLMLITLMFVLMAKTALRVTRTEAVVLLTAYVAVQVWTVINGGAG